MFSPKMFHTQKKTGFKSIYLVRSIESVYYVTTKYFSTELVSCTLYHYTCLHHVTLQFKDSLNLNLSVSAGSRWTR